MFESDEDKYPLAWSPDGSTLLFVSVSPKTKSDLWVLPMSDQPLKPQPFLNSEFTEEGSALSTAMETTNATPIKVVLNWSLEFQKK